MAPITLAGGSEPSSHHSTQNATTLQARTRRSHAIFEPTISGRTIYDISARHEVTNLEIVERVLTALDRDPAEWVEHVPDRPNHDRRYLINPEKIEKQPAWSPSVEFESGLAETMRWYVENEAWWSDVFERKGELQISWG